MISLLACCPICVWFGDKWIMDIGLMKELYVEQKIKSSQEYCLLNRWSLLGLAADPFVFFLVEGENISFVVLFYVVIYLGISILLTIWIMNTLLLYNESLLKLSIIWKFCLLGILGHHGQTKKYGARQARLYGWLRGLLLGENSIPITKPTPEIF